MPTSLPGPSISKHSLGFDFEQHAWAVRLGFQVARLELLDPPDSCDTESRQLILQTRHNVLEEVKQSLNIHGITLHEEKYKEILHKVTNDLQLQSEKLLWFLFIGMACNAVNMANSTNDKAQAMFYSLARSRISNVPTSAIKDADKFFEELVNKGGLPTPVMDFLTTL